MRPRDGEEDRLRFGGGLTILLPKFNGMLFFFVGFAVDFGLERDADFDLPNFPREGETDLLLAVVASFAALLPYPT